MKQEALKPETIITALPGEQQLFITRVFDAPREVVFQAFIDPKLFTRWMGPRQHTLQLEKFEPRKGGSWRYTSACMDGQSYSFNGVFHEVVAPERIIQTMEFEGLPEPGHVVLETARFEALPDGRTKVVLQAVYQSIADRDGHVGSGMEWGVKESHSRLDELLNEMLAYA
jgi:uncharacterized protein YndB with AHSA1/START domain